jgi:hypothetical protein
MISSLEVDHLKEIKNEPAYFFFLGKAHQPAFLIA